MLVLLLIEIGMLTTSDGRSKSSMVPTRSVPGFDGSMRTPYRVSGI